MAGKVVKVIVWDENPHHSSRELYPRNIRGVVADAIREFGGANAEVVEAHLDEPEQGITELRLANADVLVWWGHARHGEVKDEVAALVKKHVHENGLGFIALHSAHYSKAFREVLGRPGHLKGGWREDPGDEREEIRVCAPKHPIAEGISDFVIAKEEMYGAPFDAPPAQVVVFQSYFPNGGEYFPSFAVTVGKGINPEFKSGGGHGENQGEGIGRCFYFRPGHETFPTYLDKTVRRILWNAAKWCGKG